MQKDGIAILEDDNDEMIRNHTLLYEKKVMDHVQVSTEEYVIQNGKPQKVRFTCLAWHVSRV